MNTHNAIRLLNDFTMAVFEHTSIQMGNVIYEAEHRQPDQAIAAQMKRIRADALRSATQTAAELLTAILGRTPTPDELQAALTPVLENSPPSWEWSPEEN